MSVKLNNLTPQIRMNVNTASKTRQTVDSSFGAKLRNGLQATASVVGGAANMASAAVPGGTILSAALSGLGKASSTASALTANTAQAPVTSAGTGGLVGGGSAASSGGVNIPNTAGGVANGQFSSAKQMMQQQAAFSLKFLQLQSNMQNESRQFQTVSNVIKNRHQTASNSIRNIN